jgi:hypothetical protein
MTDRLHDERRARVRLETLKALDRVSGKMLNENILFADVNLHLAPRAHLSEFQETLFDLEQMGLIVRVFDTLGGPFRVMITEAGTAELATQEVS